MKILCPVSSLLRLACWVAALCLVAGVTLGHETNDTPQPVTSSVAR
ncbi:hypothetical protein FHX82_003364 [Amycolatopsis bartoniae]|nr:hypothetical protein [Amycolatopsis bartoniae]